MLGNTHQNFLSQYAEPDKHYSYDNAPISYLQKSDKIKPEILRAALDDKNMDVRAAAAINPTADAEHMRKALSDRDWYVRYQAVQNKNITVDMLRKTIKDKDAGVRWASVKHHLATPEMLNTALDDDSVLVKNEARAALTSRGL